MTTWEIIGVVTMGLVSLLWIQALTKAIYISFDRRFWIRLTDRPCDPDETVTVIIPARNEIENIETAVRSVLAQDHVLELVVLDDGSDDGTLEALQAIDDPHLKVIEGGDEPVPEGWMGKQWACQRAADQSGKSDWLLFIDADVQLGPGTVSRAVAYARRKRLGLLTGSGQLVSGSLLGTIIEPAIGGLICTGKDLFQVNDPNQPEKALGNGQFMLFRREVYEAINGHESVRGNVVEDLALANKIKIGGYGLGVVVMIDLWKCFMYRNTRDLWLGWRKNLFAIMGSNWTSVWLILAFFNFYVIGPYLIFFLSLAGVLSLPWLVASAVPVALIQTIRFVCDRAYKTPIITGQLTNLLGQLILQVLLLDSAISVSRGRTYWKGRNLVPSKAFIVPSRRMRSK